MLEDIKKYDLITVQLREGEIKNCLVFNIVEDGITIYPVQQFIEDIDYPRAVARVFIAKNRIVDLRKDNFKLLFYAVNTPHKFTREAIEFHMNNKD